MILRGVGTVPSAREHHELEMKEWRKNTEGDPPVPPTPPVCRRILTNDPTIEGLARLLVENSRGIIIVRDELAGLFSSLNQYKNSGDDESKLLELYRASPLIIDRRSAAPLTRLLHTGTSKTNLNALPRLPLRPRNLLHRGGELVLTSKCGWTRSSVGMGQSNMEFLWAKNG